MLQNDPISFTSRVDSKGRVVLSASIRKRLGLKFGSRISVSSGGTFSKAVDERGRFVVPADIRKESYIFSGTVKRVFGNPENGRF